MRRPDSVWEQLGSSFWFVPSLMTAGAVVLFGVTLQLEGLVPSDVSGLPVVFSGDADAARTVLSVILGSLITVVATVFSLTICSSPPPTTPPACSGTSRPPVGCRLF